MSSNDKIILDQILEQKRKTLAPSLTPSAFFEVFTAEQVLKDYDLSYEELEAGIVGDGGNGGIDAIYTLVNGELVQDDSDFASPKKNISLDLIVIQAKVSAGFSESPVDKLLAATDDLLDLGKPLSGFATVYNEPLREIIQRFRNTHAALASRFPSVTVSYYYASKGLEVHPNVRKKATKIQDRVKQLFSSANCTFTFLGASDLLHLARRTPKTTYHLTLAETPISSAGDVGFVCLVRLRDYHKFITDESGALLRAVFEANVRDYQGTTQVNDDIQESLKHATKEDFWWLNNGISIIASKATQSGKMLTIEDPQVVNGLQTSTEIFNYFKNHNTDGDERNLLVRVIVPTQADSRDRIIKATNSQTYIPPASLRATDKVHRDIEEYLKPYGLYYDRRKNYYKNEGRPIERIVSIPYMAQAVMAIVLQRPDTARARPSSLLKKNEDYERLFSLSHPIASYHFCAETMKRAEAHLRTTELLEKHRSNIRFHVGMFASASTLGTTTYSYNDLSESALSGVTSDVLSRSVVEVLTLYNAQGASDQVAKSFEFVSLVKTRLVASLSATPEGTAGASSP